MNRSTSRVTPLRTESAPRTTAQTGTGLDEARRIRRKKGLIRRLTAFFILFVILMAGLITMLERQHSRLGTIESQKSHLQEQYTDLKKDNADLKKEIKRLHDPDYIGQIARKDLLMSKKGEVIFTTKDSDKH